ncbi:nicastrin-like isoform X2 [Mya arenaria]|uniref:nicastrin-like isoform X2 n=1 Tax=Mya arenaria TaxID=6604 RepID=UPI0022DFAE5A|nr:nicastrin-like isoform X2 [Mya arenaria]
MKLKDILAFCVINLMCYRVYSERTKGKIYYEINAKSGLACIRRMNGTHQIGCTSDPKGNVGIVHYIEDESDIHWLIKSGPHQPYAVLLKATNFTRTNLMLLKDSGKVNGFMIMHNSSIDPIPDLPEGFSPDSTCPNDAYGFYNNHSEYRQCSKVEWNPYGNGLMWTDISLPVFILNNATDIDFIINKCYKKFNEPISGSPREYPLCAVQLKSRMDGAKDAETCIRRTRHQMNLQPDRYCDPLGDKNVFATVKATNDTKDHPDRSIIVAATRMDSFSMFETYPGDDSQVSGIVALLAAAEAIGKIKDNINNSPSSYDIMFTFFTGEAFDYIGSGRMVYDMQTKNFPESRNKKINLNTISHFVEVNQLAYRDNGKLWIHTDPVTRPQSDVNNETTRLVSLLKDLDSSLIDEADQSIPLPPASVQSFLKPLKDNSSFPSLVLTDHNASFTNKFYNSRFEILKGKLNYTGINKTEWYDQETELAQELTDIGGILGTFLYRLAMNDSDDSTNLTANVTTVSHLLYCFLVNPNCTLFKKILSQEDANKLPDYKLFPFYVSVDTTDNHVTTLVKNLLTYFLGEFHNRTDEFNCPCTEANYTDDKCTHKDWKTPHYSYQWIRFEKICMRGTVGKSKAVSIAFDKDDYTSGNYSTWTESSWAGDAILARVFLVPSKQLEVSTLVTGVIILIISLFGGYIIHKRAAAIFDSSSPTATPEPVSL